MSLLENIQSLCESRGISVPKLEKELGFGKGSIYKWDRNSPSIDKIQKVADYFGVPIDRVIHGFDLTGFTRLVNIIKDGRTNNQFSIDTGIPMDELLGIVLGTTRERPSLEIIDKLANANPVSHLISKDDLLQAAGYVNDKWSVIGKFIRIKELTDQFEKYNFRVEIKDNTPKEKVCIYHLDQEIVAEISLHGFIEQGESILEELKQKYSEHNDIQTIAAHHDGEDWTEEELEEIEQFKEFVRMKRKQK